MPIDLEQDDLQTALKKLKAREMTFRKMESLAKLGSWEVDLVTKQSIWSDESYKTYGLDKETTKPTLELFLSHLIPQDVQRAQTTLAKAMQTGEQTTFQSKLIRKDGVILDILINGQVIYDENNNPSKLIGTTQDITQQVKSQREAKEFQDLIEYSSNEIYIIDFNTYKYLYVNEGATKALGYTKEELLNMAIFDINPTLNYSKANIIKDKALVYGKTINRTTHKRKDGSTYNVQSFIHQIIFKDKKAIVIFDTDITKQVEDEELLKKQAELLHHQANHDTLTKLPNRKLFNDRLVQSIKNAKRDNKKFALLFIDLDQFKKINDSLGHHIGDEVLIEASKRLQNSIRENDTLARLGGDEFTIILKNISNAEDASKVSQKIIDAMKEAIKVNQHTLFISASVGISIYPNDTQDKNELIKFADSAMYKAKEVGRNCYQYYSKELTTLTFEKIVMENSLRIAIKEKQFVVYYQPQYNGATGKIKGMEALVRWIHPELGLVPPFKFIPIAEENGLVVEIDRLVMKDAMLEFTKWYTDGFNPGALSLNLAMKQLSRDDFIDFLLNTIDETNFEINNLELEVTEGEIMKNPDASIKQLQQLSDMGIRLAIDDFGTGYSSLSYLKKTTTQQTKNRPIFYKRYT